MPRVMLAALLSLSACALRSDVVQLPVAGQRSALVIESSAGSASISALSIDEPTAFLSVYPPPGVDRLYLLGYACGLDQLGLSAGPISAPAPDTRALPEPQQIAVREAPRSSDGRISALDTLPPEIAALQVPDPTRCTAPLTTMGSIRASEMYDLSALLMIGEDRVLAITHDRRFVIDDRGALTERTVSLDLDPVQAAFITGGRLLITGSIGETAIGTLDGPFSPGPALTSTHTANQGWIDGDPSGDELFSVRRRIGEPSDTTRFERFDGESWTLLVEGPPPSITSPPAAVAWLGPQEGVALGVHGLDLLRWKAGVLSVEPLELDAGDQAESVKPIPGLGLVIGTRLGHLWRQEQGALQRLADSSDTASEEIQVLALFDQRLVYGGRFGILSTLSDGKPCPTLLVGSSRITKLAIAGGVLYAGGTNHDTFLARIVPAAPRPPSRCP